MQGEINYDALSGDDNALDHRLHCVLALVLNGDALDMLVNQKSGTRFGVLARTCDDA